MTLDQVAENQLWNHHGPELSGKGPPEGTTETERQEPSTRKDGQGSRAPGVGEWGEGFSWDCVSVSLGVATECLSLCA